MAYTQDQLDALEAAIAVGALRVKHGQQEVTYRSLEEMEALADRMRRQLTTVTKGGRSAVMVTRR